MKWQRIPVDDIQVVYKQAVDFHGHSGPYLALGVVVGLYGLKKIGSTGYSGIEVVVRCRGNTPDTCFIDGLQVATGCTMGKRNLTWREGDGLSAEFRSGDKHIKFRVIDEYEGMAKNCPDYESGLEIVEEILNTSPEEIVEVIN